jgi:adenine/guanine phosphoribosyltransferase-like PRPP-binding protein
MTAHTSDFDHVYYFRVALHPEKINKMVPAIIAGIGMEKLEEIEAVAFMGNSGALLAPLVALYLGKTLIMVRKTTRGVHSSKLVEGDKGARKYIIVDDVVATGTTARKIMKRIKKWSGAECLGVLEMNDVEDDDFRELTQVDL